MRQTRAFCLTGRHPRFFDVTVDWVLRPLGRADKPMEACELQPQPHHAHPAGANLNTHAMEGHAPWRQEGEPGHTLAKRHDNGTRVQALVLRRPGLERAAGHLKPLSGLTLGETSRLQRAILLP
jgi:hypothetical protein